ncbi:helix-turn-helix transcriptional regulator [Phytomonospora sp. NPDC050363]|uniref:helix-turn-helix domain-containing protein n=1 Tax=Phytomonospora sp. NPDC050363 TaxID=3155642 RepID=UPI003402669D
MTREYLIGALITARRRRGMSQRDLASRLGVTQGCVSQWEQSNRNLTIDRLCEWADVLDLHVQIGGDQ